MVASMCSMLARPTPAALLLFRRRTPKTATPSSAENQNGLQQTWRHGPPLKQQLRLGCSSGAWTDGKLRASSGSRLMVVEGAPRKGKQLCWCQRDSEEVEKDESGVLEVDSTQELQNAVGSSQQGEVFSRLPSTISWGGGVVATTMVIFWAGFHIPLGLGGLAVVAKFLPQQSLDPQTEAVSLVLVQLLEVAGTVWLIQSTLQPFGPMPDFFTFRFTKVWRDRGWLPASAFGLVILLVAVGATASVTQDVSPFEVDNGPSAFASLLTSTPLARLAMYVAYCGITPCLEEYVYRGFLLSSLCTVMRWPFAVMVSALVFSVSHFSLPGLLSLFWIGCCLGTAYTWTGNLATSFVIHSLYNAIVLTRALLS